MTRSSIQARRNFDTGTGIFLNF